MSPTKEQAADWFARIHGAPSDHPDRVPFEAWLEADPVNVAAYSAIIRLWGQFDTLSDTRRLNHSVHQRQEALRRERRRIIKFGILGVALAGGAGGLLYRDWRNQVQWKLAERTGIGQIKSLTLPDGSIITAGADSGVRIDYSRAARRVTLDRGEAIFDVTPDVERPFVIDAGASRVTVLGTRFAVTRLSDHVRVSVDHGRVRVSAGAWWNRRTLVLADGQVAETGTDGTTDAPIVLPVRRAAGDGFAFARDTITFDKASLGEIAETLSRYRAMSVRVDGDVRSAPTITAVVHFPDIEAFLTTLPQIWPVTVTASNGQTVLSTKKNEK